MEPAGQIILYTLTGIVALVVNWALWFRLMPMIYRQWRDQFRRMRERKESDAQQREAVGALLGKEARRYLLSDSDLFGGITLIAFGSGLWALSSYHPWGHIWIGAAGIVVLLAIYTFERVRPRL